MRSALVVICIFLHSAAGTVAGVVIAAAAIVAAVVSAAAKQNENKNDPYNPVGTAAGIIKAH